MRVTEELIRRIERAEACMLAQSASQAGGDVLRFGSGVAAFCGPGDVLTQAAAVGLDGQLTAEQWDSLWAHYDGRCDQFEFKLSPMAATEVAHKVAEHAIGVSEFETFLVQELTPGTGQLDAQVEEVPIEERAAYVRESAPWFYPEGQTPPGLVETISAAVQVPNCHVYAIRVDGELAGGASLSIQDGIAWFSGGVVRPDQRRQGFHRRLIAHRLAAAVGLGAEISAQSAHPGSLSQLNAQFNGFSVAYTRPTFLVRPG